LYPSKYNVKQICLPKEDLNEDYLKLINLDFIDQSEI